MTVNIVVCLACKAESRHPFNFQYVDERPADWDRFLVPKLQRGEPCPQCNGVLTERTLGATDVALGNARRALARIRALRHKANRADMLSRGDDPWTELTNSFEALDALMTNGEQAPTAWRRL